jgi:enamine deaminase RidA (YjgF/YER057c/UK114 family)
VKQPVRIPDLPPVFAPYPAAMKHAGLVFVSGVRPAGRDRPTGFDGLPEAGTAKRQGFGLADLYEGQVSADSWVAHAALASVLRAAGSSEDQILRQHIWQRDKRFFPCYERVRVHFQAVPAPSSGLGVAHVVGQGRDWIGMDAIAVAPGENPAVPARAVVSSVDNRNLPSASHYSQAVRSGDLVFTAGHIAIKTAEPGRPLVNSFDDVPEEGRFLATGRSHPDSRDGPIAAQSWYIYNELRKLLSAGGLALSDVVLATVFLADLRDFAVFHRVHRHFFPADGPALCVTGFDEVGHRGCRIEIELTALARGSSLERSAVGWPLPAPFAGPAALKVGPVIFYAGMVGVDRDGRLVGGADALSREGRAFVRRLEQAETRRGLAAQCWASFEQLAAVAEAAGSRLEDLLKMTVYVGDPGDLATFEAVRAEFIADQALPAFECVAIHGPGPVPDAHVQIEAIGAR